MESDGFTIVQSRRRTRRSAPSGLSSRSASSTPVPPRQLVNEPVGTATVLAPLTPASRHTAAELKRAKQRLHERIATLAADPFWHYLRDTWVAQLGAWADHHAQTASTPPATPAAPTASAVDMSAISTAADAPAPTAADLAAPAATDAPAPTTTAEISKPPAAVISPPLSLPLSRTSAAQTSESDVVSLDASLSATSETARRATPPPDLSAERAPASPEITMDFVCLGVGPILTAISAQFQLALFVLLCREMRQRQPVLSPSPVSTPPPPGVTSSPSTKCHPDDPTAQPGPSPLPVRMGRCLIWDPCFTQQDASVLEAEFGIALLPPATRATYRADGPAFLFLPHCPNAMVRQLLKTHADTLDRLVLLSNDPQRVRDCTYMSLDGAAAAAQNTDLLGRLLDGDAALDRTMAALPVANRFVPVNVFNDMAFVRFPPKSA
ncbi:hypothetical protein CXG81DRAFT_19869 [Caulochytrium protostelioides]|uniref:SRR1-like domain-containing protein n=1 Tax=Caulochytrium protostelioides TaxID=1555241 RepID=A0A4V1IUD1_9FUNG|nr:hypothetical protein CXG81DRAFT_19869 [Caulochytrium protostelioides]|eukprot:RKP00139.1 hypothetical protein CXG81DRAFT_19869 [Caulochytrium protostelioides]